MIREDIKHRQADSDPYTSTLKTREKGIDPKIREAGDRPIIQGGHHAKEPFESSSTQGRETTP